MILFTPLLQASAAEEDTAPMYPPNAPPIIVPAEPSERQSEFTLTPEEPSKKAKMVKAKLPLGFEQPKARKRR